jgi:4-amino-4-deoxy-L-arabinose transferase-like glycosyltransferase
VASRAQQIVTLSLFLLIIILSTRHLTTYPRLWYDEAINLQAAKNLAEQGYWNIQTAPGHPYEWPHQFLTTGYPVSAPLGIIFMFTGFSFLLARIYVLCWMILFLTGAYFLTRRLYSRWYLAIAAVLLLITFAPVISKGRTLVGEIPGTALLFWAVYLFEAYLRRNTRPYAAASGLMFGLAIAAKPLFLIMMPALLAAALLTRQNALRSTSHWALLVISLLSPLLVFFWLVYPLGTNGGKLHHLLMNYNDRVSHHLLLQNIKRNLPRFFTEGTFVYTFILSLPCGISVNWKGFFRGKYSYAKTFLALYAIILLLFFVQSIGWPRYLLVYQCLILIFLPAALEKTVGRLGLTFYKYARAIPPLVLVFLILFQTYHLVYRADIFTSDVASNLEEIFRRTAPSGSVYVLLSPYEIWGLTAAMIPSNRLNQFIIFQGQDFTPNRLADLDASAFDYLSLAPKDQHVTPYAKEINKRYVPILSYKDKMILYRRIDENSKE